MNKNVKFKDIKGEWSYRRRMARLMGLGVVKSSKKNNSNLINRRIYDI